MIRITFSCDICGISIECEKMPDNWMSLCFMVSDKKVAKHLCYLCRKMVIGSVTLDEAINLLKLKYS